MAVVSPRTAASVTDLTILTHACSHPHPRPPAATNSSSRASPSPRPRPPSALYDHHTLPFIIKSASVRLIDPIHLHRQNPVQQNSLINMVGSKRVHPLKQPVGKRGDHHLIKVPPRQLQVNCEYFGGSSSGSSSSSSSCGPPSLYSILGLEQSVAIPDIKRAFRNLALQYHPDVLMAGSPAASAAEANQNFLQLQDAYRVLSDPKLRADYDHHRLLANSVGDESIFDCNRRWVRSTGRWSRRTSCTDDNVVQRSFWKWQWEAQVRKLRGWGLSGTPEEEVSHGRQITSTWGSRMRSQNTRSHNT